MLILLGQSWRLVLSRAPLPRSWVLCHMALVEQLCPCPFLTPWPPPAAPPRRDPGRDPWSLNCLGFLPRRQTQHWREGRGGSKAKLSPSGDCAGRDSRPVGFQKMCLAQAVCGRRALSKPFTFLSKPGWRSIQSSHTWMFVGFREHRVRSVGKVSAFYHVMTVRFKKRF